MGARGNISMTAAAAAAHQKKHGFKLPSELAQEILGAPLQPWQKSILDWEHPKKPRMNKTEVAYSLVLGAMKRRGEIADFKFEGMSLSWGADPKTDKPMWFTGDFTVWVSKRPLVIEIHEVKGAHIWLHAKVRFKGCRAEWPMFTFKMMQKKEGIWQQVY